MPPWRIGAVLAVALAAAFVVWLLVRHTDKEPSAAGTTTAQTTKRVGSVVVAATLPSLKTLATHTSHPIYWAGPRAGTTYELTESGDGRVYIRYLPQGTKLGTRSAYMLVATYPVADGYKAVQDAAKRPGATSFHVGKGLAVASSDIRTNVYLSFPGARYQVEVFDPRPGRARALVKSGALKPVPRLSSR